MQVCSEAAQWQRALSFQRPAADAQLISTAMSAWLRGQQWRRALELFCDAQRRWPRRVEEVAPCGPAPR